MLYLNALLYKERVAQPRHLISQPISLKQLERAQTAQVGQFLFGTNTSGDTPAPFYPVKPQQASVSS